MEPSSGRGWISLVVLAKNTQDKTGKLEEEEEYRSRAGQIVQTTA